MPPSKKGPPIPPPADEELQLRRALAEAEHGAEHLEIIPRLEDLALWLHHTHQSAESEALLQRALTIREEYCLKNPPVGPPDFAEIVKMLLDPNRKQQSEVLRERYLVIYFKFTVAHGYPHPKLAGALTSYDHYCQEIGVPEQEFWQQLDAVYQEAGLKKSEAQEILEELFGKK